MDEFLGINILELGYFKRGITSIRTRNKGCCVLSCRISGSAIFYTNGTKINVNTGDVLFIPRGQSYTQGTSGEEIIYIHIEVFGNYNHEFQHIVPDNSEEICELFKQIADIWNERGENYRFKCISLLYSLIAKTSVMLRKTKKDFLSESVRYINEQFSLNGFSLDDACEKSNVSRAYFNRVFKKEYNMTPVEYINKLKIDKAKFLLLNGAYTNEEVASLCGFSDVKYFYTVFKKLTGTTAFKYKNNKNVE